MAICLDFDWQTNEFMLYCRTTQLREKTMLSYEQTLRLFEKWCIEEQSSIPSPLSSIAVEIGQIDNAICCIRNLTGCKCCVIMNNNKNLNYTLLRRETQWRKRQPHRKEDSSQY